MSHSGQQHPTADNGGQRPADSKKAQDASTAEKGSTKDAVDAGKAAKAGGTKDARK